MRPVYGSPEAAADDNDVDSCLGGASGVYGDRWTPLRRIDDGAVPVLPTRIGDRVIGLRVLAPDGVVGCGDPTTGPVAVRLLMPSEDLTVPRAPGR